MSSFNRNETKWELWTKLENNNIIIIIILKQQYQQSVIVIVVMLDSIKTKRWFSIENVQNDNDDNHLIIMMMMITETIAPFLEAPAHWMLALHPLDVFIFLFSFFACIRTWMLRYLATAIRRAQGTEKKMSIE